MAESGTPSREPNDLSKYVLSGVAGDFVFREGEPADGAYIVEDGRIEIVHGASDQVSVATLGRGDVFGEDALFDGRPRDASARALTDFQVVRVDRATFERLVQEDPLIGIGLARRLASYVREYRNALCETVDDGHAGEEETTRVPAAMAPPPLGPAKLVLGNGSLVFTLTDADATIGRVDRQTGQAPDIDLTSVDTHKTISRLHAQILARDGRFFLREEPGVRNGTFVNGRQVPKGGEVELREGAEIRFGQVRMAFTRRAGANG